MIGFTHMCLITEHVQELKMFYQKLLMIEPELDGETYVEFHFKDNSILAIYNLNEQNKMALEDTSMQHDKNFILEFQVEDDIYSEYERVNNLNVPLLKPITTQEWGTTSFWFKDPDGNYIDFYKFVEA